MGEPRRVGVVLFEGFELLDVFGPLEMFGLADEHFVVEVYGPAPGPVQSAQGQRAVADAAYSDAPPCDIVLVPGGRGTRALVKDRAFLNWFADWAERAPYVTSVCTGAAVLAASGLLDGYRATTNKASFSFPSSQGSNIEWVTEARWVEDRTRWTSSGVSAGMDMALALISHIAGEAIAEKVALDAEYEWHRDAGWDPFAARHGLVEP